MENFYDHPLVEAHEAKLLDLNGDPYTTGDTTTFRNTDGSTAAEFLKLDHYMDVDWIHWSYMLGFTTFIMVGGIFLTWGLDILADSSFVLKKTPKS